MTREPARGRAPGLHSPARLLVLAMTLATVLASVTAVLMAPGVGAASARRATVKRSARSRQLDPREFEPGACVEYLPTSSDRHVVVFLDAGHGGIDPGGVGEDQAGNAVYEADETLPVELDAMALLRDKGFTVVVSRTKDETVSRPQAGDVSGGLFTAEGEHDDVAARDLCADKAKAKALVGIYFDAGGTPDNAGSVTGYDTDRSFSAENLRLATLVQSDVLDAMNAQGWGIPNLGVTDDSQLGGPALTTAAGDYGHLLLLGPADPGWFSTPSEMPGALVEPLFITDPFEASIAESAPGQRVIAGGVALALEQYFAPKPEVGKNSEAAAPHHGPSHARLTTRRG